MMTCVGDDVGVPDLVVSVPRHKPSGSSIPNSMQSGREAFSLAKAVYEGKDRGLDTNAACKGDGLVVLVMGDKSR